MFVAHLKAMFKVMFKALFAVLLEQGSYKGREATE